MPCPQTQKRSHLAVRMQTVGPVPGSSLSKWEWHGRHSARAHAAPMQCTCLCSTCAPHVLEARKHKNHKQHTAVLKGASVAHKGGQGHSAERARTCTCACEPALGDTELPCWSAQRISTCTADPSQMNQSSGPERTSSATLPIPNPRDRPGMACCCAKKYDGMGNAGNAGHAVQQWAMLTTVTRSGHQSCAWYSGHAAIRWLMIGCNKHTVR